MSRELRAEHWLNVAEHVEGARKGPWHGMALKAFNIMSWPDEENARVSLTSPFIIISSWLAQLAVVHLRVAPAAPSCAGQCAHWVLVTRACTSLSDQ